VSRHAAGHEAGGRRAATLRHRAEALAAAHDEDRGSHAAVLIHAHRDAETFYRKQLAGSWAETHLQQRHLQPESGTGYAPAGWTGLTTHLHQLGYTDTQLLDAGLGIPTRRNTVVDRFRDRLMFTVNDATGAPVAFVGRKSPDNHNADAPKYLNSPETAVYRKSETLYGLGGADRLIRSGATPVLVEGAIDAQAVTQASRGRHIGLAALGAALTAQHVQALADVAELRDRPVLLGYDADAAGYQATERAAALLHHTGAAVDVLTLPAGDDPARAHRRGGLAAALADPTQRRGITDVLIGNEIARWREHTDLRWPEDRVGCLRACARIIADAPPAAIPTYTKRLAAVLNFPLDITWEEILEAVSPTPADHQHNDNSRWPSAPATAPTSAPASPDR
jgi:DNA primase